MIRRLNAASVLVALTACEAVPRSWQQDAGAAAEVSTPADALSLADVPPVEMDVPARDAFAPQDVRVIVDATPQDRDAVDGGSSVQRSCTPSSLAGCGTIFIPGGTFTLGDGEPVSPSPAQRDITVSDFYIDRFEVTVARFRRFASQAPRQSGTVRYPNGATLAFDGAQWFVGQRAPTSTGFSRYCNWTLTPADREAHPINCLNWNTAQAFCAWDGGRLPTEAEWEFVARGAEGRRYPWGEVRGSAVNCFSDAGSCPEDDLAYASGQTPQGVWHMSGNLQELTADRFVYFGEPTCWGGRAQRDPLCTHASDPRERVVIRGDNFVQALLVPGTNRAMTGVSGQNSYVGLRCVRSAP
ncbi:MAG: hypothetical protein EPO40_03215 [Myxococcaceae bacterium]|nr:MAG: hypothetical protein EPO40_03215 [Myxococcaceae bacterium]